MDLLVGAGEDEAAARLEAGGGALAEGGGEGVHCPFQERIVGLHVADGVVDADFAGFEPELGFKSQMAPPVCLRFFDHTGRTTQEPPKINRFSVSN